VSNATGDIAPRHFRNPYESAVDTGINDIIASGPNQAPRERSKILQFLVAASAGFGA